MREFHKKFEDVYSNPLKLKKCDLSQITTDIGLNVYEYIDSMKKMMRHFEMNLFDNLVKYVWLTRRFYYKGEQRLKYFQNGHSLDGAFGVFMKHHIGTDKAVFNGKSIYKVLTYFKDFFPDMDKKNPFEEKMEFPYKHIGLSYLCVVYQMDDRLEFLDYAEKNKMRYTEFLDYMINYMYCVNEENDKEIYKWSFVSFNLPFVNVLAKNKIKSKDATISKKYESITKKRRKKNEAKRKIANEEKWRILREKRARIKANRKSEKKEKIKTSDIHLGEV